MAGLSIPGLSIQGDFSLSNFAVASIPSNLYGLLPQLYWFNGQACAPTSITNGLVGLAAYYDTPTLLADGASRHAQLLQTRLDVAEAIGTTDEGSIVSNYTPGLNDYLTNLGLNQEYAVAYYGLTGAEVAGSNAGQMMSELISAFARGIVVFTDVYNGGGGHALLGTSLELNDFNANGIIEKGEAHATIIDPLNPASAYAPNAIDAQPTGGTSGSPEPASFVETWNNTIQAAPDASPNLLKVEIYQDFGYAPNPGALTFNYDQSAVQTNAQGEVQLSPPNFATGTMAGFIELQKSALPDDIDGLIGASSANNSNNDCIFDFSNFLSEGSVTAEVFAYFNESSEYANTLGFYQVNDFAGTIQDPITGQFYSPGDGEYIATALQLSTRFNDSDQNQSNGELADRVSQDASQMGNFSFTLDAIDGKALVAPIVTTSAGDTWTVFAAANSDGLDHFLWNGGMSFRMEDLPDLGDRDFNDLHAVFTPLTINGIA